MKYKILTESPEIIKNFLTYNETVKGKSSLSIEEYYHDLTTFFRFLKLNGKPLSDDVDFEKIPIADVDVECLNKVTLQDLHAFLVFCKEVRGNGNTTRARKASTLRIFFKYLSTYLGVIENNPAALLDTPTIGKTLPCYLTLEESITLLNSVDGPNSKRDYCILTLFLNCGMRLSELCGINITDIRADGTLRIIGKGNKERMVFLNNACLNAINDYLTVRNGEKLPQADKNALFISRNNRRLSNKTVQHLVDTYLEKAGLGGRGFSTHKLRHTAATLMYQKGGVDIRVLKEILGHCNLGTTQIYTHVADRQIEDAIKSNPLAEVKLK